MKAKLYIIDDDIHMANMLATAVEGLDVIVNIHTNPDDFFQQQIDRKDIILLDMQMPHIDGVEVIRTLGRKHCKANLILMSGKGRSILHSAQHLAIEYSLNMIETMNKPIKIGRLQDIIKRITAPGSSHGSNKRKRIFSPTPDVLRKAIHNKEFILHYQPQVHIKTKALMGVEALVRWQHPELGLLYPTSFISLAEKNGLISDLTGQIIIQAIEQYRVWYDCGLTTRISVNISAENINSLSLPEQLEKLLKNHHLDPEMLTFEVTESVLMDELVTSLDILTRLRMKGFGLSIDDFGTGYSSLRQLHRIPFTELKVDQSFITSMDKDEESYTIVKTCIMLGHELGMEVVAEGVENEEILNMLKKLNCDIVQGFFIAKPMNSGDFTHWLENWVH